MLLPVKDIRKAFLEFKTYTDSCEQRGKMEY